MPILKLTICAKPVRKFHQKKDQMSMGSSVCSCQNHIHGSLPNTGCWQDENHGSRMLLPIFSRDTLITWRNFTMSKRVYRNPTHMATTSITIQINCQIYNQ